MDSPNAQLLEQAVAGRSLWQDALMRLRQNKLAMTGLYFLLFMIVLAMLTPWITPYTCLLYTSPSPRDRTRSRMPSSA